MRFEVSGGSLLNSKQSRLRFYIQSLREKVHKKERIKKEVRSISDYFDIDFYNKKNSDVAMAGVDPVEHYCISGWKELRDPSPNFSTRYYLNSNRDVAESGLNPFVHFVEVGMKEGRAGKIDATSIKDGLKRKRQYVGQIEDVEDYFDEDYYLSLNPDVLEGTYSPIEHYMRFGWKEGRDPSEYFSTSFYLRQNPDISASGVNPFWHYVVAGKAEGRPALPVMANSHFEGRESHASPSQASASAGDSTRFSPEVELIRGYVDVDFYTSQVPNLDGSNDDPVHHFFHVGWHDRLDPSEEFSVTGYLDRYPDVASAGVNPLWHYVVAGRDEGREKISREELINRNAGPSLEQIVEDVRPHFDDAYYLFKYADVREENVNPLHHFCDSGWKEGRDPCSQFSTLFYLETNEDVAKAGINPFWHYIVGGKNEGRASTHPGGYRVQALRTARTLEQEARAWRRDLKLGELLTVRQLEKILTACRTDDCPGLLVSFGHDHYREVRGGVQLCVHREEALAEANGLTYLNVHPSQPLPRLAKAEEDSDTIIALVLAGEDIGFCRISDLTSAMAASRDVFQSIDVVVHHLLGHLPERVAEFVKATGRAECWYWLHDFFSICPSFTLQRNGVSYCGAPPVTSNACTLCRYGTERQRHMVRVNEFFSTLNVHVLSPSQVTADLWERQSELTPASLTVHPHMQLEWKKRTTPSPVEDDRITFGFLGTPAPHKGWDVFEGLFHRFGKDSRYRFIFLGGGEPPAAGIEHKDVHVTAEQPDAMIDSVIEENVDLVLHWASWPETFSLSTYEAYAGGAYVITNKVSGNVAATVRRLKRGKVFDDETDLHKFLEGPEIEELVDKLRKERRKSEVHHQLSRMVHDMLDDHSAEEN